MSLPSLSTTQLSASAITRNPAHFQLPPALVSSSDQDWIMLDDDALFGLNHTQNQQATNNDWYEDLPDDGHSSGRLGLVQEPWPPIFGVEKVIQEREQQNKVSTAWKDLRAACVKEWGIEQTSETFFKWEFGSEKDHILAGDVASTFNLTHLQLFQHLPLHQLFLGASPHALPVLSSLRPETAPQLRTLSLANVNLSSQPRFLLPLLTLATLERLSLSSTHSTLFHVVHIVPLAEQLKVLDLSHNEGVGDDAIPVVGLLVKLESLSLKRTTVSMKGLMELIVESGLGTDGRLGRLDLDPECIDEISRQPQFTLPSLPLIQSSKDPSLSSLSFLAGKDICRTLQIPHAKLNVRPIRNAIKNVLVAQCAFLPGPHCLNGTGMADCESSVPFFGTLAIFQRDASKATSAVKY
ncbi:hypothetical protein T439DRAFT_359930 [Meredithblackwellia eburnea MCA 4105]